MLRVFFEFMYLKRERGELGTKLKQEGVQFRRVRSELLMKGQVKSDKGFSGMYIIIHSQY